MQPGEKMDPVDVVSELFGKRCVRLAIPGYERRQRITVGFDDGSEVTVWGASPADAWKELREVADHA